MRNWTTTTIELPTVAAVPEDSASHRDKVRRLQTAIESVIQGKPNAVRLAVVALLARGHVLIEDVPGVGKTTLAQALARALDGTFARIQFTSDLLPSDVLGRSIYNQRDGRFEWQAGAIFANVVLADEINRATPKTQSALLEAMAEGQVTVEGTTRPLPTPFVVVATQNPTEHHGTYPLPESQLDRFMLRLEMGYPAVTDEKRILRDRERRDPLEQLESVITAAEVVELQEAASAVRVDESLLDYLMQIVTATRQSERLELGISPRGTLALFRAAQSNALVAGRDYCTADDIKSLVVPAFAHRVIPNHKQNALSKGASSRAGENILREILTAVKVPI